MPTNEGRAKTMITPATIIVASKDQLSCDVADDAVILNLKNAVCYGMDAVGARIWGLIQAPITVGALRDALVREYDVPADQCQLDLLELTQKLLMEGIIELID
jgi:hypothetical protein